MSVPYNATVGDYVQVFLPGNGDVPFMGTVVHSDATHFDVKFQMGSQMKFPQGTDQVQLFSSG